MPLDKGQTVIPRIARYGLPIVILVFYLGASWTFPYTSDAAYLALQGMPASGVGDGGPVWYLLLAAASRAGIDLLLAAKVLSLFFGCSALLCTYLVAFELLRSRLAAFTASLVVATSAWMLQAAPGGTALTLAAALALGTVFFFLRNEYLPAIILSALTGLIAWQAWMLAPCILLDIAINSRDRRRGFNVMRAAALVFAATLLPWVLYSAWFGVPVIAVLASSGIAVGPSGAAALAVVLCAAGWGSVQLIRQGGGGWQTGLRAHFALLSWICFLTVSSLAQHDLLVVLVPFLVIYAFGFLLEHRHAWLFAFAGVLVLLNQFSFAVTSRPVMAQSVRDAVEIQEVAWYLRAAVPASARVAAEKNGILSYYAGRPVERNAPGPAAAGPEYVVCRGAEVQGYACVHRVSGGEGAADSSSLALWRRL